MAIGSKYVYEIETEEKARGGSYYEDDDEKKSNKLRSFLQDGVNEMKKEMNKKLGE